MIEINNLKFGYRKRQVLFNNLSLKLNPGFIYGLLGKNGAGKTTLLKQMTGLLFPDQGDCFLFGKPAGERLPSALREIFLLPEEFYLPPVRMKEYKAINASFYPAFSNIQFENYLKELEVDGNAKLTSLSYGQKKSF